MNIAGIGGMELVAILIIMLVIAGPKRMVRWSYLLGQYVAKFRVMWGETVDMIQKEFDAAGVDVEVPRELPTRQNISKQVSKAFEPVTRPVKETLDEVGAVSKSVSLKPESKVNGAVPVIPTTPKPQENGSSFGTWSGQSEEQK
jgi:Sec-independent protein translocase protein TatA